MQQHKCEIVPNFILKKVAPKDQVVKSFLIRSKRDFLLANPTLRSIPKKTHHEIRRLFDSQHKEIYSQMPIAVDEQMHSVDQSQYTPLEMANRTYDFFHNDHGLESYDNKNSP